MHAFSVLVTPLELRLDVGRGRVSLVYALALVVLTVAVRVFGDLPYLVRNAPLVASGVGLVAWSGLLLAASTSSYLFVVLGYGVIFGAANGIGYAAALEWGAASSNRAGMAMALATAAYAVGAAVASLLLDLSIGLAGLSLSLSLLGLTIAATGVGTTSVLRRTTGTAERVPASTIDGAGDRQIVLLWVTYGLSVLAGLMALGHGAEILRELGASDRARQVGVVLLTLANAIGGFAIAASADRLRSRSLVMALPMVAAFALIVLAFGPSPGVAVIAISLVGVTYGAVIAVYPPAILLLVGTKRYPASYGRVFSAWAVAGLAGPLLAGALFDQTGSYRLPLLIAAAAAVTASVTAGAAFGRQR